MEKHLHRSNRGSWLRASSVIAAVAVNVLTAFISFRSGMPIYLDTLGTVAAGSICGLFPAIMTAIATNAICTIFNSDAVYFSIVNAFVAIFSAWFVRERSLQKLKNIVAFPIITGTVSGIATALIQWGLLGGPQNHSVRALMETVGMSWQIPEFLLFILLNIALNILDKSLSLGITLLLLRIVPKSVRDLIKNSGWRQKPLSYEEKKKMDVLSGGIRFSLKHRMIFMFITVALTLTFVMGLVGIRLYFKNAKQEKTMVAESAVKFAAELVDPDMVDEYIRNGERAEGYKETEDLLYKVRENAVGVEYLYITQIRKDGCYVVFDLDTEDVPAYEHGEKLDFEEAFEPYLAELLAGQEIEPIESNDISGWVLTVYEPIRDADGKCVAYAGADVSLSYMADYMGYFLMRVILILAGFFLLVIAYALWVTGIHMVYPINAIVTAVEDFISAGTDQEKLDDSVRKLRAIDVSTSDEVERLYHAVCDMALNQTEQMRSIRRFSENTAKMQDGLIITMADLVENRDSDTGAHIQKTAAYVRIIVEGLKRKGYYAEKITPKFMSDVVRSAPLHDVGKINIPDNVLNKPGKLTDEEYEIIKTHTTAGRKIMEKAISTVEGENYLKEARNMAAYHHERWDGKGYPEGLHGEVIPLAARIMAVADVFDALASPRVYKPAFPLEKALTIIQEGAGSQFDPKCVEVFMESLPEVKAVLKEYSENE
ncbi:MAG: HD domain-containing protein [Ruminococcus sp.]|nr:HD domain-containing protein [Ruminococcus sp.]